MKQNGRFITQHLSIDKGTLEQSTQANQTWAGLAAYVLSSAYQGIYLTASEEALQDYKSQLDLFSVSKLKKAILCLFRKKFSKVLRTGTVIEK